MSGSIDGDGAGLIGGAALPRLAGRLALPRGGGSWEGEAPAEPRGGDQRAFAGFLGVGGGRFVVSRRGMDGGAAVAKP